MEVLRMFALHILIDFLVLSEMSIYEETQYYL